MVFIPTTPGFPIDALSPSRAIYTTGFENSLIQDGYIFGFSTRFTVPGDGTYKLIINPTAFSGTALLMLPALIKGFGAGPLYIDIYKNPEYSGGTEIAPINFNFNSSNTSDVVVKENPAITDNGTLLPNNYAVFSAQTGGFFSTTQVGGEASTSDLVYDLNTDDEWLYIITNQDATNDAEGTIVTDWAELP